MVHCSRIFLPRIKIESTLGIIQIRYNHQDFGQYPSTYPTKHEIFTELVNNS